ncbi:MAG: hypothetical protein ACXABU_05275 [Candidatus Hodarchaeales archaeon]|jgi:hypothetical protein
MSEWDLVLYIDDKQKEVYNKLKLSDKTLAAAGQHGKATILVDNEGKEWLLKVFSHIIDFDVKKVSDLDIDIQDTPEKSRERLHLWRVLNEITASRLGRRLHLNVPESHLICSGKVVKFALKSSTILKEEDVVVLDEEEEDGETAEEFYNLSEREIGSLTTSDRFEEILAKKSSRKKAVDVLAILQEKIPNSRNIDEYLDDQKADLDGAFAAIQNIDDAFLLLPFDIWLNDPDRNAGNYLVQMDKSNKASQIWGIDYEMWSFGSDIWMEEDNVTQGRSYLTAIIHPKSHIFDSRVNQTFYRIRMLQDEEIIQMTKAPKLACKFFEYHINKGNLHSDEREKLKHVEVNLEDFLIESRPRSDKLSEIIARQIGLPKDFKT